MSLKENIENNPILWVLSLLLAGFLAGISAYKFLADMVTNKSEQTPSACSQTDWEATARKADWIPKLQCPAYPVSIKLTSPGSGSIISVSRYAIADMDLIVQASRPLPSNEDVGFVVNQDNKANYYV